MKPTIVLILLILFNLTSSAQSAEGYGCFDSLTSNWPSPGLVLDSLSQPYSYLGGNHTPKGDLHILIVFISFDSTGITPFPNPSWGTNWPLNSIPEMAQGSINELFNQNPNTISSSNAKQNLSEYFYQMSMGDFLVTADIYPDQIKVPYQGNTTFAFRNMNRMAIDSINSLEIAKGNTPDSFWSQYDNRENDPGYLFDNSSSVPDNNVDYIAFIYRKSDALSSGAGGFGDVGGTITIPNSTYMIPNLSGHTMAQNSPSPQRFWDFFTHEFAHNLYFCPHYMGANGIIGKKYLPNHGWGFMSQQYSPFFTANAWERWWLGWQDPVFIADTNIVVQYDLEDYVTSGDAIAIEIPGSNGQLLWLENHQKISRWDTKVENANSEPQSTPGLYAYITHSAFNDREVPITNALDINLVNGMKLLPADGRWDIEATTDSIIVWGVLADVPQPVFDSDNRVENFISGVAGIQSVPYDGASKTGSVDGIIRLEDSDANTSTGSERQSILAERISGNNVSTYEVFHSGDEGFQVGDEVGINGIIPVFNFSAYNRTQEAYVPTVVNGLSVRFISQASNGTITIEVDFGQSTITENRRWCGNLSLTETVDSLIIAPGDTLSLDLSGTPDRITIDPTTGTFANPSVLSVDFGAHLYLDTNSTMEVKRHSQLVLKAGSILELADGATLNVKNTGSLIADPGSIIKVHGAGEIIIHEGGTFTFSETQSLSSAIVLHDNSSCIRIEGNLDIADTTKFTFTGDGFLALDLPSAGFFQGNITVGTNASIELEGSGTSDKILFVEDGSYFLPGALENFSLKNGKVELGYGAQILLFPTGDSLVLENLTVEAANYPSKHNGIFFIEHGNHRLNNLTITDGAPGMGSWQGLNPTGQRLKITNSTFANNDIGLHTFGGSAELVNCNFVNSQKGWQADVAIIPGEIMGGSIQGNADRGIRYFGPGDLHLEDLYLASQVAGLDLYGHSTLTGECVEFASHTGYATLLANGAGADLYPYLGSNYPQWEFNNNNYSILLDSVHHILINDGYTNLRAGASGPNTLFGSQRVNLPPGLSYDASHNRWNTANTSPVSGIDYQVISDLGSITFSDPSPGSVACPTNPCPSCSDENPDGSLPLFACSECQSVSILVDPASSGGEPLEQGYDEHLVEAMRMISTIGSSGSDDEEAAWRLLSLAVYSLSSPNSDEIWLQGIAHRLLLRAMNAAALSGVLTRADSSGLSMDALSTAFVDYLDDQISATSDYSLLTMYQINKAAFLRTLGDRSGSLSEFEDIRSEVLGNDRDMVDQWICLLEYEDDLYTQQIDPVTFWSLVQSCTNGESTSRREAPQSDSKAIGILEEFGVKVYPNPATHTLKIEMNVPEETDVTLTLLNANGQLVHRIPQQSVSNGAFIWTISTEELPSGIYLLRINSGAGIQSRRVIVE